MACFPNRYSFFFFFFFFFFWSFRLLSNPYLSALHRIECLVLHKGLDPPGVDTLLSHAAKQVRLIGKGIVPPVRHIRRVAQAMGAPLELRFPPGVLSRRFRERGDKFLFFLGKALRGLGKCAAMPGRAILTMVQGVVPEWRGAR